MFTVLEDIFRISLVLVVKQNTVTPFQFHSKTHTDHKTTSLNIYLYPDCPTTAEVNPFTGTFQEMCSIWLYAIFLIIEFEEYFVYCIRFGTKYNMQSTFGLVALITAS